MSEVLTSEAAASLDAEAFRVYHLSDLLRRVRARTAPPTIGGVVASQRGGVTQEQAAQLLDVSERHYREFERGRLVHPDPRFLDHVARVMAMTAAERDLLYRLAARRPPVTPPPRSADIKELQPMLDAMGTPALVTDIAWNILAWNRELADHLQDPAQVCDADRNSILWRFGPVSAARFPAEQRNLGVLVGWVRFAYLAEGGQNPALGRLAARLLSIPDAARHWNDRALALEPLLETRMLVHPLHGQRRVRVMRTLLPQFGLRISQFIPVVPGEMELPAGGLDDERRTPGGGLP